MECRKDKRGKHLAAHDDLPYFHGEVEECVNGGVLAIAAYFGELGEGSERIISRLLDERLDDGGWNCEPGRGLDAVVVRLDDLRARGAARLRAGGRLGMTRDHRGPPQRRGVPARAQPVPQRSTGEIVHRATLDFSFPPYWFYDVLRALDYFREAGGAPDPRIADAIELVLGKRADDDDGWPAPRVAARCSSRSMRRRASRAGGTPSVRCACCAGGPGRIVRQRPGAASTRSPGRAPTSPSSRAIRARAFCSLGDIRPSMRTRDAEEEPRQRDRRPPGPPQAEQFAVVRVEGGDGAAEQDRVQPAREAGQPGPAQEAHRRCNPLIGFRLDEERRPSPRAAPRPRWADPARP